MSLTKKTLPSLPPLPQTGWFIDQTWATIFGLDLEYFRKKLKEHGIPYRKFGKTYLIRAEDFYQYAPGTSEDDG